MKKISELTVNTQIDCETARERDLILSELRGLGYKMTGLESGDDGHFETYPSVTVLVSEKKYYTCIAQPMLMDDASQYLPASDFLQPLADLPTNDNNVSTHSINA